MRQTPFAFIIALGVLLAGLLVPSQPAAAANELCFPETGQCIRDRFKEYWEQNGGLAVFGYPIAEARNEVNPDTGQTYLTQWFQRNRFEYHPENARPYDVLLGRLGNDRLRQQGRDWFTFPKASPSAPHYFAETGHAIADTFWGYWSTHGLEFDGQPGASFQESLALFGLPISEPAMETNSSGDTVVTQWYERARFEYHPNNPDPYKVLLGLLGDEVLKNNVPQPEQPKPQDPCADVPDPVSGRVRPSKCVERGTIVSMDVYGFRPNEQVGYWLNAPDGSIVGTVQTVNIGPSGSAEGMPFDTARAEPGLWYWVFEGTESKHQAVIYVKVLPSSKPQPTCGTTPDPVNARLHSDKCLQEGEVLVFDIYGFKPNEQVGYWLTTPEGDVFGTVQTRSIGPSGGVNRIPFDTNGLYKGLWYWVFEGVESKHQSIIYFYIEG